MPEPLTLATVGAVVLSEGVKFLYGQAGEVLKRWRERKARAGEQPPDTTPEPANVAPPPVLAGAPQPLVYHFERVDALEPGLRQLWAGLAPYAQGLDDIDPANAGLVEQADALRRLLEAVYGQRITFRGEAREPSGAPVVVGTAEVGRLAGEAAGVVAGTIGGGVDVRGELSADEIEAGGSGYGVKADKIGG